MSRVTFISRMTVKVGHEAEFVRLCTALAERVHATESKDRTLYYEFYKLREPRRFAVIESFANEDAEHAHMTSNALAELGQGIVACLDGEYVREYLDPFTV